MKQKEISWPNSTPDVSSDCEQWTSSNLDLQAKTTDAFGDLSFEAEYHLEEDLP